MEVFCVLCCPFTIYTCLVRGVFILSKAQMSMKCHLNIGSYISYGLEGKQLHAHVLANTVVGWLEQMSHKKHFLQLLICLICCR